MAGVAERVGIRAPSLYHRFDDRADLLVAVATEAALDLGRALADAVAEAGADPALRLDALAAAHRPFALATPRASALLFAGTTLGVAPTPDAQAEASNPMVDVAQAIVGAAGAGRLPRADRVRVWVREHGIRRRVPIRGRRRGSLPFRDRGAALRAGTGAPAK